MKNFIQKLKNMEQLPKGLRTLYFHKVLRDVAMSLIGMFGVIFIYQITGKVEYVLYFWGAIIFLYLMGQPLFAKLLKHFSMHKMMFVGHVFLIGHVFLFFILSKSNTPILWVFILLVIVNALNRLFYWVPYHVDFARFVNKHHRGRQLSFLSIMISILGIFVPIISSLVIFKFGFSILFMAVIILLLLAIIPIFSIPHTREEYSFGYWETFKKLFSKKHVKSNLAYVADGFQEYIGAVIWPIFIFILFQGNFLDVGFVSAGIILGTCVLRYMVGEAVDKSNKKRLMKIGSVLYSLGWALKALVSSITQVFFVGIYHDFSSILMRTPFDVLMYEIAADEGHYVDEFTILREMALNIGRVIMVVSALILLSLNLNVVWIFVLGAIVSLFLNLISKEEFLY